jgi:hypothetical protein
VSKNLGKTLVILLYAITLSADIRLLVDKDELVVGDVVTITIEADYNDDVIFEDPKKLASYKVLNTFTSSQTNIINGKMTKIKSKAYTIRPSSNFTIPPLKVIVDSKEYYTKQKDIKVHKRVKENLKNAKYIYEIETTKSHLRVGESFSLKLIFKRRVDTKVNKIKINDFSHEAFWIKKDGSDKRYIKDNYEVYEKVYTLTPQRAGSFNISNLVAKVGILKSGRSGFNDPFFDSFFQRMSYQDIYSNSITLQVQTLPKGVELFGDFNIKASVDKSSIEINRPVNLTIRVDGDGNLEDIKKFDIDILNATVYSDEPTIKDGVFTQKVAILSENNFTIPSIKLSYFDKMKKRVISKKTDSFFITVFGTKKQESKIKRQEDNILKEEDSDRGYVEYIYLLVGIIIGLSIALLVWFIKRLDFQKDDTSFKKRIKRAKNDRELYALLLPFSSDKRVADVLSELEEGIYSGTKSRVDRREILNICKYIV